MADRRRIYARFIAVFVSLGVLGLGASVYTLVHQRFPLPFGDRYTLRVELQAADGVVSGIGQPVNVVGVKVGQVVDAKLRDGRAVVTRTSTGTSCRASMRTRPPCSSPLRR